jgi:hypothetical protein
MLMRRTRTEAMLAGPVAKPSGRGLEISAIGKSSGNSFIVEHYSM